MLVLTLTLVLVAAMAGNCAGNWLSSGCGYLVELGHFALVSPGMKMLVVPPDRSAPVTDIDGSRLIALQSKPV
eukprot:3778088-Amphidinium_carterae.1